MKIYGYMEHGTYKNISEDTMLINDKVCKEGFYYSCGPTNCIAIADGVGGNPGGKEASEFVIDKLKGISADSLKESVYRINEELISYAKSFSGKERMATTLTALFIPNSGSFNIIHVGNTRLYAIQGEYLKQLTRDHTTIEYLKSRGQIDAGENAPQNEITACFGAGTQTAINQLQIYNVDKDYCGYVLTSDGFHDYLDIEQIESFIASASFTEKSFAELGKQAIKKGSSDDKSIIIIKIRG